MWRRRLCREVAVPIRLSRKPYDNLGAQWTRGSLIASTFKASPGLLKAVGTRQSDYSILKRLDARNADRAHDFASIEERNAALYRNESGQI